MKSNFYKICVSFSIFVSLFHSLNFLKADADIPGIEIKKVLENELLTQYLPSLEKLWGNCGTSPESCLTLVDESYYELNLPKKSLCFPNTKCGFYKCMEKNYQCESVGVNYFTKLAYPTCSAYEKNIQNLEFTKVGVEWVYTVMVCLQKGLIDECIKNGRCAPPEINERKKVCDQITDFTLRYHPGCYIHSGVGVCRLPIKDKIAIWKTVSPYLTTREKEEAKKVIFYCLKPKA